MDELSKRREEHNRREAELFGPGLETDREALKDPVVLRAVVRALWRVGAYKGVEFPGDKVADELGITEWAEHTSDLEEAQRKLYPTLYGLPADDGEGEP